jgi:hypothetical protein
VWAATLAPAVRFRGGGSSGNRVNATPTTDSTRVLPRRKSARRGTCLRVGTRHQGPGKADDGEALSWSSGEQSCAREGGKQRGKRAGDDAHRHAELQQRTRAAEQQDGSVPELDGEDGGTAGVARQKGGGCGTCGA